MGDLSSEGPAVRWSDGTRRPMVVSGGSDVGTTVAPAGPEPVAPDAAAPAPEAGPGGPARDESGRFAPSPAAGAAADEPTFHDLGAEYESLTAQPGDTVTLDKARIARWNDEHKRYREKFQPLERAFSALHDDDRTDILNFVGALGDEAARPQAVAWMRGVLDRLTPAQQQQVAAAVEAAGGEMPTEEEFDPFDPSQIDKRVQQGIEAALTKRDEEARKQREVEQAGRAMQDRAKALGYKADATDDEYAALLLLAQRKFANDPDPLGRAHEAIERRLNERAAEILKAKRADAQETTVPSDGAAPSGRKEAKTMEDAAASARSRLDSIFGGQQQS